MTRELIEVTISLVEPRRTGDEVMVLLQLPDAYVVMPAHHAREVATSLTIVSEQADTANGR
jgi:hypothetical protein